MKKDIKHFNSKFGTDGEFYVANLWNLERHPQGFRRPDLISRNGTYTPRLSMEVKSGRKQKGVLYIHQLQYNLNFQRDYEISEDFLEGVDWRKTTDHKPATYYYNQLNRLDGITSEDIRVPFGSIQLNWGDQCLVPGDLSLYIFAIGYYLRDESGTSLSDVICRLEKQAKEDSDAQRREYTKDSQSWQNLNSRDIIALFEDDFKLASSLGRKRLELLKKVYDKSDLSKPNSLRRVKIAGPNGTNIYILANPEDENMFNVQARKHIESRAPKIERISEERKSNLGLLRKLLTRGQKLLFGTEEERFVSLRLNTAEQSLLKRLSTWQ